MNSKQIMQIFRDTAYIRTGGSDEEKKCAGYLTDVLAKMGLEAHTEPFAVAMAKNVNATLTADGSDVPCEGYRCAGSGEIEAPLYYMTSSDSYALKQCKGKIVLFDGYLGYWKYHDLVENGAVGFITYDGDANYRDYDIDKRELRKFTVDGANGVKLPGVNINAKSAISIIKNKVKTVRISLSQDEYEGESQNVVLDMPGDIPETIVFTAHYDSTPLSTGAYDNMSGSIGLIYMAEYFKSHPHRHSLRFVWCGSEERGLLGSKAYCAAHEDTLSSIVLNINLDMIGSIMGGFIGCCTSEDKLAHYISYLGLETGFSIRTSQDVYSSDSTPFADRGIPAVSFARGAPHNTATIHNRYDTTAVILASRMIEDCTFITKFSERIANAVQCPVERKMPDNMKNKLDNYLCRKREG
jgi:hypothetical protein